LARNAEGLNFGFRISNFGFRISTHPTLGLTVVELVGEADPAIRGLAAEPRIACEPFRSASVVTCESDR
jgi:hypothetical protein